MKPDGLSIHNMLRQMYIDHGVMMSGINAELIGEIQAERSFDEIKSIAHPDKDIILRIIQNAEDQVTKPTNSCGEVSNQICRLLLGDDVFAGYKKLPYQMLSDSGDNFFETLPQKDQLIRFEVDRYNAPITLVKLADEAFELKRHRRNQILITPTRLIYIDRDAKHHMLVSSERSAALYQALGEGAVFALNDPYILNDSSNESDKAICTIVKAFEENSDHFDCWRGSHSFTIYLPHRAALDNREFYPYQAFFSKYSLRSWFLGEKDIRLSQKGLKRFIDDLALLGKTGDVTLRSRLYAKLFGTPGRENSFCVGVNEQHQSLRIKFKRHDVDVKQAIYNMTNLKRFMERYIGEGSQTKLERYQTKAMDKLKMKLGMLVEEARGERVFPSENSYQEVGIGIKGF